MNRYLNFFIGFFLFLIYRKNINILSILKGKRIAVIGAADSAFNTKLGGYIDKFDIVIRINKAPYILKSGQFNIDIGSKTDILFHSFYENEKSGGGKLDLELFDSLGIKYLVNPIVSYSGYRVIFNFYKKYLKQRIVFTIPKSIYNKIATPLLPFKPTIGYCALYVALQAEFKELYITGFTFFKTPFGDGYRNHIKEVNKANELIKLEGHHNPDKELYFFKKEVEKNSNKRIMTDKVLALILEEN